MSKATITLSIRESAPAPDRTFVYHIHLGGEVIVTNQSISGDQAKSVAEFSRTYLESFEGKHKSQVARGTLASLGDALFSLWFGDSVWSKLAGRIPSGAHRTLVIASDVPDILNLPWEVMREIGADHTRRLLKLAARPASAVTRGNAEDGSGTARCHSIASSRPNRQL